MKRLQLCAVLAAALIMTMPAIAAGRGDALRAAVDASGYALGERSALHAEADRALRAGVPAGDLEIIVLRARDRGLTAAMVQELIRTAAQAAEQGSPVRPVLDRMEQGLSKGAPGEMITAASQRLAGHLAAAGPMVSDLAQQGLKASSPRARDEAVETVARALEHGVPGAAIGTIGGSVREQGQTAELFDRAVRSLSLFVGAGMPVDDAVRLIQDCVEHRFVEREYARLERSVNELLRQGVPMDEVLSSAGNEVRGARDAGQGRNVDSRNGRGSGADRESGGRSTRGR